MSNFKLGIVLGFSAFIISLILGAIFGVNIGHIILRAFIFLVIFFGLGVGVRILINNYFPELLYSDEETTNPISFEKPDTQINLSLGRNEEFAVPENFLETRDSSELGNIEELLSGAFRPHSEGVDQKPEEEYNIQEGSPFQASQEAFNQPDAQTGFPAFASEIPAAAPRMETPVFTPSFGDGESLESLPDLGAMAMAFSAKGDSSPAVFSGADAAAFSAVTEEPEEIPMLGSAGSYAGETEPQYNKGNKAQPLQGDFDPKDIAMGIRTVLSKDDQ